MILPEDTKPPIDSDNEDEEIAYETYEDLDEDRHFYSRTPGQSRPIRLLSDYSPRNDDQGIHDSDYPLPLSPGGGSTHPLLPYPDEIDVELGPAPPYTPRDNFSGNRNNRILVHPKLLGKIKSARLRFAIAVTAALVLYVILSSAVAFGFRIFRHGWRAPHRSPYDPRPGDDSDGSGDGDGGDENGQWRRDGIKWECANFTEQSTWNWVSDESADNGGYRRAGTNITMLLPFDREDEIFAHLAGPAAVGPMLLNSYDAFSKDVHHSDMEIADVMIGPSGPHGDHSKHDSKVKRGKYVKIMIESLFDVISQEGFVAGDLESVATTGSMKGMTDEKSPGWEMLRTSNLCLMERRADREENPQLNSTWARMPRRAEGDRPTLLDGLGLGIYTHRPEHSIHPNPPSNPLRFRIHVFLPSTAYQEKSGSVSNDESSSSGHPISLAHQILESLSPSSPADNKPKHHGPPDAPPPNYISSLELRGGVSDFALGDLTGVELGHVKFASGVGSLDFGGLRAERIEARVVGTITGSVGVSESLEVDCPVGAINLNLSLISPPEHVLHVVPLPPAAPGLASTNSSTPPPPPPPGPPSRLDLCTLPPVSVTVKTGSDSITLYHGDWDVPCRGVKEDVRSVVGPIEVYPHALFQGPYKLGTVVGSLSVSIPEESIPDPEGQGRWRNITLEKQDRLGAKQWSGEVSWEAEDDGDDDDEDNEDEEEEATFLRRRSNRKSHRRQKGRGLEAYSSAGSVAVVF